MRHAESHQMLHCQYSINAIANRRDVLSVSENLRHVEPDDFVVVHQLKQAG